MRAIWWYMSRLAQFWNADKQIVNIWEPSGQPVVLDRCEDQHHLTKLIFCCRNAKKCLFCLEKLILPHFWHKYFKDKHAKHIVPRNLSSILKVGWKKDERECKIVKPRSKVKSCLIKANHICRNFLMSNPSVCRHQISNNQIEQHPSTKNILTAHPVWRRIGWSSEVLDCTGGLSLQSHQTGCWRRACKNMKCVLYANDVHCADLN